MTTERMLAECSSFRAWWYLARTYNALLARLTRRFEERGITGAQFGVLRCLSDAGEQGLRLSDLSRKLLVTCGNTTGIVDRMEQAGYLYRRRSRDDRREVWAHLTPEGRALFEEVLPAFQETLVELLGPLEPEERETLGRCCEKLYLSLTVEDAGDAPTERTP